MDATEKKAAAFVSYSRVNSEFVLRLAQDLRAAGAAVWLDQIDIQPGELWDRAIETALKSCPKQLVVLSPEAVGSVNVMDEVSFALEQRKRVIPVLCQDCEIPFRLRRVQYIDFRTDYGKGLKELLRAMGTAQQPETFQQEAAAGRQATHSDTAARPTMETSPRTANANETTRAELPVEPKPGDAAWDLRESGKPGKKLWTIVAGVIALVLAVVLWQALKPGPPTDSEIETDIRKKINADDKIPDKQIIVSSVNRVVYLSGSVSNDTTRNAAASDAGSVSGVKSVVNNLQLVSSDAGQEKHKNPPPGETQQSGSGSQQVEKKPDHLATKGVDIVKYGAQIGLYNDGRTSYWTRDKSSDVYQFVPMVYQGYGRLNFAQVNPPGTNRVEHVMRIARYGQASDAFALIKVDISWDRNIGQIYHEFTLGSNGKLFDCSEVTLYSLGSDTRPCNDSFARAPAP